MILSVGIFSRMSFSEASIIKDENQSSNIVVLDESHSAHCSFSTAAIASDTRRILYVTFSVGKPDSSCSALSGLMKL